MDPNPFYAILALIHIPVAVLLIARIVKRQFVSDSIILHISFLSYWLLNGVRFGYRGFVGETSTDFSHVLTVIQAICCLPLCVYIIPKFSQSLLLPCIAAYDNKLHEYQNKLFAAEKALTQSQEDNQNKIETVSRIVRNRIKQIEALKGLIRESKEYETLRTEANELVEELKSLNRKLEKDTLDITKSEGT